MVDLVNVAKAFESIQSTEEKWLYVLRSAHKASSELEVDDEDIADALKRIRVDSADDELLKRQASDMVTQDEIDCRIAEAILDSRAEGRAERNVAIAKKMLLDGESVERVAYLTDLPEADVIALKQELCG